MKMKFKRNKLVVSMAAALTMAVALPVMTTAQTGFFINDVVAAEDGSDHGAGHAGSDGGSKGYKGGRGTGQKGGGQGGSGGKGGHSTSDVLAADEGEEDSDRPDWAGQPGKEGKPGGGSAGDSTKKGGDYGDIVVMLRDDLGNLIVDGTTTYAVAADGTLISVVDGEIPEGSAVQAVEFGRLNVARSPASVLEHSLVEALSKLSVDGAVITLDAAGRLVVNDATIDSPLESLALYEALLTAVPAADGTITLSATTSHDGGDTTYTFVVPTEWDRLDLAASALAAASDKTGELTIDEIVGISSFIGVDDELAALVGDFTFDPMVTYPDSLKVDILIESTTTPGTFVQTTVEVNDYVDVTVQVEDNSIKDVEDGNGIDEFADAANTAVQVLEFVHDNAVD